MTDQQIDEKCDRLRAFCIDACPWFWLAVAAVILFFVYWN